MVGGKYQGQTGRVVNVNESDGISVAAVLTDGINSEIQCNVNHLQVTHYQFYFLKKYISHLISFIFSFTFKSILLYKTPSKL